jgi:hypothetical protein
VGNFGVVCERTTNTSNVLSPHADSSLPFPFSLYIPLFYLFLSLSRTVSHSRTRPEARLLCLTIATPCETQPPLRCPSGRDRLVLALLSSGHQVGWSWVKRSGSPQIWTALANLKDVGAACCLFGFDRFGERRLVQFFCESVVGSFDDFCCDIWGKFVSLVGNL